MARWQLAGSTALVLVLGTTAARADITPEEVWANWQAMITASGQTLTADSATRDGDTLEIVDLEYSVDDGAGFTVESRIDEVSFTDLGDGTVEVTLSESYPVTLTFPATETGGTPTTVTLQISQPGLSMIASGDTTESSYDFEAPTLNIKVGQVEGVEASAVDLVADVTLTGVEGAYTVSPDGDATDLDSTLAAASVSVVMSGKDPETDGDFRMTASIANLAGTSTGTFLPATAMADMMAALNAGFAMESAMTYGATAFKVDLTEAGKPTNMTGSATGGDFTVAMDKTKMAYGSGMRGAQFSLSGADIPFPKMDVSYAEGAFKVLMPIAKSDVPQDFSFLTRVVDLVIPAPVWDMMDPTAAFPRDPATIIVDAKGTANWAFDIMDPAQQAAMQGQIPGQIHSLEITNLEARAAGAEVKGTGAFTFDNTDLVTWEGVPTPTGKLELAVNGANGVLDKLVAMGMVPEDQAMGMRMMVAMFAKPGAGEDQLTSTLEFKDKGFYANGQKLR